MMTEPITIKYGHAGHTCLVFSADALPLGTCQTLPEAMIMVTKAHDVWLAAETIECLVSGQTLDRFAEVGSAEG